MSFEFNPAEEDPHGECAHEIHRLQDELAKYRELAHRAVVASHMRQHGGINKPLFDDCREGFCGDWHAIGSTQTK